MGTQRTTVPRGAEQEQVRRRASGEATGQDVGPVAPVPLPASSFLVGAATDSAEHDADRRADVALARLATGGERAPQEHVHEAGCGHVHRSADPAADDGQVGLEGGQMDGASSARLQGARGGGRPLDTPVLRRMETAFGASFGAVRVHDDERAAQLSTQISARAFTTGKDVFFARGQYSPGTPDGERVLAHELAHTLQPQGAVHRWPWDKEAKEKRAAASAAKKQKAGLIKESKSVEKDEDARLEEERAWGVGAREQMKEEIASGTLDEKSLRVRFEANLANEKQLYGVYLKQLGGDENKARDAAYKTAWVETDDSELRAVRPPRETASERLASEVRQTRTDEGATSRSEAQRADDSKVKGDLLDPQVEEYYDRWSEAALAMVVKGGKSVAQAYALAGKLVWETAPKEVLSLRPTDKAVDHAARLAAEKRVKARSSGVLKKEASELDSASEVINDASSYGSKASTVLTPLVATPLSMAGKPKNAELLKDAQAGGADMSSPEMSSVTFSSASKVPILGGVIKSAETADYAKKNGIKDPSSIGSKLPKSTETKAAEGIGQFTGLLTDLMGSANAIMKFAKAVEGSNTTNKTDQALACTKAGADGIQSIMKVAKDAAELAKFFDAGVAGNVAAVVPGFNIVIAVMGLVSNVTSLADSAMHLNDSNKDLVESRLRRPDGKPLKNADVLIRPLLNVTSAMAKKLAGHVHDTVQSVSSTATSIATVASAGGFGIPAAVDAGMKLVSLLNTAGHAIADNVIAVLAKQARADATGALEGSAEKQMKRDPGMAVDAIIVQARKGTDPVALRFVERYGYDKDTVKTAKLGEVRSKILEKMGTGADPQSILDKLKALGSKVTGVKDAASARWKSTQELADARGNDDKSRGTAWRLKQFLRSDGLTRSMAKTKAQSGVRCTVGKAVLTWKDCKDDGKVMEFVQKLLTVPLSDLQAAAKDGSNELEFLSIIEEEIMRREKVAA